jgi:hypothetical protein
VNDPVFEHELPLHPFAAELREIGMVAGVVAELEAVLDEP